MTTGLSDTLEAGGDPANPIDSDEDGIADYRETDSDDDGLSDTLEAGGDPANPVDSDEDGIADYRETDSDGDGLSDTLEAGDDPANPTDTDEDGVPDYRVVPNPSRGSLRCRPRRCRSGSPDRRPPRACRTSPSSSESVSR